MGRLCLSMGHEKIFLMEEELAVCERQGRCTRLYHRYGQTDVRENLDAILRQNRRMRYCHQSFLVDPARIFRFRRDECQVRMPDGSLMTVPVSKKYSGYLWEVLCGRKDLTGIP